MIDGAIVGIAGGVLLLLIVVFFVQPIINTIRIKVIFFIKIYWCKNIKKIGV